MSHPVVRYGFSPLEPGDYLLHARVGGRYRRAGGWEHEYLGRRLENHLKFGSQCAYDFGHH